MNTKTLSIESVSNGWILTIHNAKIICTTKDEVREILESALED